MTELEKVFIIKAFEEKNVSQMYSMRNSFFNAYVNANRKKGKKEIPLIKKKKTRKADPMLGQKMISAVEDFEKERGDLSWIHTLYAQFNRKISK